MKYTFQDKIDMIKNCSENEFSETVKLVQKCHTKFNDMEIYHSDIKEKIKSMILNSAREYNYNDSIIETLMNLKVDDSIKHEHVLYYIHSVNENWNTKLPPTRYTTPEEIYNNCKYVYLFATISNIRSDMYEDERAVDFLIAAHASMLNVQYNIDERFDFDYYVIDGTINYILNNRKPNETLHEYLKNIPAEWIITIYEAKIKSICNNYDICKNILPEFTKYLKYHANDISINEHHKIVELFSKFFNEDNNLSIYIADIMVLCREHRLCTGRISNTELNIISEIAMLLYTEMKSTVPHEEKVQVISLIVREAIITHIVLYEDTLPDNIIPTLIDRVKSLDYTRSDQVYRMVLDESEKTSEEPAEEADTRKISKDFNKVKNKTITLYKKYEAVEDKVDNQLTKLAKQLKDKLLGDPNKIRDEIVEGKKYSVIGVLKSVLGTISVFSASPVLGIIQTVAKYAISKKVSQSERRKIIAELETELELIEEKIDDAKGDSNRKAKYSLMRTRSDLKQALQRIKYHDKADGSAANTAKSLLASTKEKNNK